MYHQHRKRQHVLHLSRVIWLGFLIFGLLLVQLINNVHVSGKAHVLAYATNVNRSDLHTFTNQERSAAGLGSLALNGKLNQAAQSKAEHMIANNYWAHTAPDGTTPWYWFNQAGYSYLRAGENLAYGFTDSYGVSQGWMNSPGHRANVLGDYSEVGFGYANGSNYQGGQNTVVVAMYGLPAGYEKSTPAPASLATPSPSTPPPPAPTAQPAAEPSPPPTEIQNKETPMEPAPVITSDSPGKNTQKLELAPETKPSTTIAQALRGQSAWPLYASLLVIAVSTIGFGLTHLRLMRLAWHNGYRFAAVHPILDAAVVSSLALLFLSATVGFIK